MLQLAVHLPRSRRGVQCATSDGRRFSTGIGLGAAAAKQLHRHESTGQEISAFPDRPVPMVVVLAPWIEAGGGSQNMGEVEA